MKKAVILLVVLILSNCSLLKYKTENEVKKVEIKTEKLNIDSITSVEVNKAIKEKFSIPVPKSNTNDKNNDSIIDLKVREILSKMNFKKKSGSNGYGIKYNQVKDLLEFAVSVGATKNESRKINLEKKETEIKTEFISKYISKVKNLPIWVYVVLFLILFRKPILSILGFFFPFLNGFKFFNLISSKKRIFGVEKELEYQKNMIKEIYKNTKKH